MKQKLSVKQAIEVWDAVRVTVSKLEKAPKKNWRKIAAALRRKIFD